MGGIFIEQLTISQKRSVVGGKISGALLNGIASIIKNCGEFFSNVSGTIATCIFTQQALGKTDKLEYKIGNSSFKVDNTSSNKAKIESTKKTEVKVIPTPPTIVELF